jgi:hypothetical protein
LAHIRRGSRARATLPPSKLLPPSRHLLFGDTSRCLSVGDTTVLSAFRDNTLPSGANGFIPPPDKLILIVDFRVDGVFSNALHGPFDIAESHCCAYEFRR